MIGTPTTAKISWRENRAKEPSFEAYDVTDDDESTMTRPNSTRKSVAPRSRR
jgi:hypothetical protein